MHDRSEVQPRPPEKTPVGQRLFDNWLILLVAGVVVMAVFYTLWGLWEVTSLSEAPLP